MTSANIKVGDYIVVQKQNYKKLVKFNKPNTTINISKYTVDLSGIDSCPYFSVFKMTPKSNKNREYCLEFTDEAVNLMDEILVKSSGNDNRNISDDGNSQSLTATEIEGLKNDSCKASDIVEKLINHSSTFHSKTEFSQEKYLKKKEKKYFEYLQIQRPTLRIITEVMYKLEPSKIQGIRMDTLSQIMTLSNVNSAGLHLLYDSGSNGLLAAALLSAIGSQTDGKLIHMHPGNMSQKQAILAMNFNDEQLSRCISVNVYSVLRQYYQGCDTHDYKSLNTEIATENPLKRKADNFQSNVKIPKTEDNQDNPKDTSDNNANHNNMQFQEPKKPKWHFDNIAASELLHKKVDSLVIACKEDPSNIFNELVTFVKPGRPFVIYYATAEPLHQLYLSLRSQSNVAALKVTCNWMRNYQVLLERTHPEVMMNTSSGFLLSGYVLK